METAAGFAIAVAYFFAGLAAARWSDHRQVAPLPLLGLIVVVWPLYLAVLAAMFALEAIGYLACKRRTDR